LRGLVETLGRKGADYKATDSDGKGVEDLFRGELEAWEKSMKEEAKQLEVEKKKATMGVDWDAVERVVEKEAADQMKQGEGFTEELNLRGKSITAEGCRTIAPALRTMTNLQWLNLGGNNFGDEGLRIIAPALRTMPNLKGLYLGENNIGDEGLRIIAPALRTMPNLEWLNLSDNNIGDEGCRTIAPALRTMPNLEYLNLSHNNIGDDSVAILCSRVLPEISLERLDLDGNKIGNVGCQSLLELFNNGSLPSLIAIGLLFNLNISSELRKVFKRDWKAKGKDPHNLHF
jgi:Ran GTPase-activating protein (RanGAP) involved in mRNA processing and transport